MFRDSSFTCIFLLTWVIDGSFIHINVMSYILLSHVGYVLYTRVCKSVWFVSIFFTRIDVAIWDMCLHWEGRDYCLTYLK